MSDQRTEPVYEIDLRDLADEGAGPVVIPDADPDPAPETVTLPTEGEALAGDPPPGDVPALLEMPAHPRPARRRIACERLGYQRARAAVDPLLERLQDPERGVRIKAADALALIGDERAIEPLERARAADPDLGVAQAMERAARTLAG
ncbi:MAG TPA: HEAT repeat domain-containing protein [Actinomycetota bacterium]